MKKSKIIIWTTIIITILSVIVLVIGKNNSNQLVSSKIDEVVEEKKESSEVKIKHQNVNAIEFEEYLELFTNEFPTKVYLSREPEGVSPIILNGELLSDKYILMNSGSVFPPINGHAHSYKRVSDEVVWLITYKVGRYGGASDIFLNVINENQDSLSGTYLLSNSFGEDGYFSYQNGEFVNDSTFQYKKAWNNKDFETDSLTGIHKIR
jgi:hypothetical protein